MALLRFSGVVSAASGKIGGVVFRIGKGPGVAQAAPTNCTNFSSTVLENRASLEHAQVSWAALDDTDHKSWAQLASLTPEPSRVGTPRYLTGRMFYIRHFLVHLKGGGVLPVPLPSYAFMSNILNNTIDFSTAHYYTTLLMSSFLGTGFTLYYGARSFSKSGFTRMNPIFLTKAHVDPVDTYDLKSWFQAKLGIPSTGEIIALKVYTVTSFSSISNTFTRTFAFPHTD